MNAPGPSGLTVRPEQPKALTGAQEREIVALALMRNPGSAALRLRLATLHNELDDFDATVAVLTDPAFCDALEFKALNALTTAYFARGTAEDTQRGYVTACRAFERAENDVERSAALTDQAKALQRQGCDGEAITRVTEALQLDPHNRKACKRLVTDALRKGDGRAALALTDQLAAQGVTHARLQASRTLALASLDRIDDARLQAGLERFACHRPLPPPPGWDRTDRFNAALAAELMAHPGLRYERHGTASRMTWRIEAPTAGNAPLARTLLDHIARSVEAYAAELSPETHPWLVARPKQAMLRSWCVITEHDGMEARHIHPGGWMSGGYYVQIPDLPSTASDGCLEFGLPDDLVGRAAADCFGRRLEQPRQGSLILFPSHAYHRTYPHGRAGRRICVAFDVIPA